jgi:predicted Zn-dependent protease
MKRENMKHEAATSEDLNHEWAGRVSSCFMSSCLHVSLLRAFLCFLLLCTAALTTGCVQDATVISQANQVNTELKPAILTDPELSTYIQQVGDRIITAAQTLSQQGYGPDSHKKEDSKWMFSPNMKFHFVNSKTLNAFTTGGEHMYIYTALFEACKSEDELAAVMAHEYAHVYCRHVQQGMNRQYAVVGTAVAAGAAGYALGGKEHGPEYAALGATAGLGIGQFIGMGFTRQDVAQADKVGFKFYTQAGWDPAKFADFFKYMIDKGYDTTPEMLSDHPSLANRVKTINGYVKDLPPQAAQFRKPDTAPPDRFHQLQQRAIEIDKQMPDDKSVQSAQNLLNAFPSCVAAVDTPQQKEAQAVYREKVEQKK